MRPVRSIRIPVRICSLWSVFFLAALLGVASDAQNAPRSAPLKVSPVTASQPRSASALPSVPATSLAASQSAPSGAPTTTRATVLWDKGLLRIDASNSSLNGILRDIALRTGMKIEGGVLEERVFGTYGPAPAATVLQQLLEGSKTNVLIQSDDAMIPVRLTLTPKTGGASPPGPMTAQDEYRGTDGDTEPLFNPNNPPAPQAPPGGRLNTAPAATNAQPSISPGAAQDQRTTQDQSPNGVSTPQQILEQLRKLRDQQAAH